MGMTTDIAERTLQAAKAKALEMGERVAIGVVDARGDLWSMVRLDGSGWTTSEVCRGKAAAAAAEAPGAAQAGVTTSPTEKAGAAAATGTMAADR